MDKNKISEGDIWSVDTIEVLDFYSSFVIYEKNTAEQIFQVILCDTNLDDMTSSDLIIPEKHTSNTYDLIAKTDLIIPVDITDERFIQKIGEVDSKVIQQIQILRNESKEDTLKLEFEIGKPILWKSDLRYAARIEKLKIVDYLASDLSGARSFVELDTSNVLFMIEYKNNKIYDTIKKDKNFIDLAPALERDLVSIIPDKNNEFLKIALVA
tara:strand:+ start:3657 stop:4292 length:636 start_codon:yes stop_codon:yes gene_type:complete